jgi:hypothetical protein
MSETNLLSDQPIDRHPDPAENDTLLEAVQAGAEG